MRAATMSRLPEGWKRDRIATGSGIMRIWSASSSIDCVPVSISGVTVVVRPSRGRRMPALATRTLPRSAVSTSLGLKFC
jgi:hypothetical protein